MHSFYIKISNKISLLRSQASLLNHKTRSKASLSAFFFTTHKCASSFVPNVARTIQRTSRRICIDYEIASWHLGDLGYGDQVSEKLYKNLPSTFHYFSHFYAPLRCPPPPSFTSIFPYNPCILFLRDPRDIAISAHYSFGHSHSLPKNTISRKNFLERRKWINSLSLDEFCIEYLKSNVIPQYQKYYPLLGSPYTLYLRYSDYVSAPTQFFKDVLDHLGCDFHDSDVLYLAETSNSVQSTINTAKHQRSGQLEQFKHSLSADTNSMILHLYEEVLTSFGFN